MCLCSSTRRPWTSELWTTCLLCRPAVPPKLCSKSLVSVEVLATPGRCTSLGQEQPMLRIGKCSSLTPKSQPPPCPSASVSAAPWWAQGGIICRYLEIMFPPSTLVTWRSAQAVGAPGLSSMAFSLQKAPPPISRTLSETPSGREADTPAPPRWQASPTGPPSLPRS